MAIVEIADAKKSVDALGTGLADSDKHAGRERNAQAAGIGERPEDLRVFDAAAFVDALLPES